MRGPDDTVVRLAAFHALDALVRAHGPVLDWEVIRHGFDVNGLDVHFASRANGIFKPAGLMDAALSIKTTVPRSGRLRRYDDLAADDGYFVYDLRAGSIDHHDNRALRAAHARKLPIIYFLGVAEGRYEAIYPCYVENVDAAAMTCVVSVDRRRAVDDVSMVTLADLASDAILLERRYRTRVAKERVHQHHFRELVLNAYQTRCAICRLPKRELLEAAHIVPDSDERGEPIVSNGLALCSLHHGAFDRDLLGIRPDLVIEVAAELMALHDGPTLEHGVKRLDGARLEVLPRRAADHPDRLRLEERWQRFVGRRGGRAEVRA